MEIVFFPGLVHLGNLAWCLCGGNAIFRNDAFRLGLHVAEQENMEGVRAVSQDIVGASSDDDTRFLCCQTADDPALCHEQGVVVRQTLVQRSLIVLHDHLVEQGTGHLLFVL